MTPAPGKKVTIRSLAVEGMWTNNPIFFQVLGICSTLAVTNLVMNTITAVGPSPPKRRPFLRAKPASVLQAPWMPEHAPNREPTNVF